MVRDIRQSIKDANLLLCKEISTIRCRERCMRLADVPEFDASDAAQLSSDVTTSKGANCFACAKVSTAATTDIIRLEA
jgi:hypothetical protein